MRQRGLDQKQGSAHIDLVQLGKVGAIAVLDVQVRGHASVVDDDVDLQLARLGVREVVQRLLDEVCRTILRAHVCLYAERVDAVLFL